jgi:hypothetical protein
MLALFLVLGVPWLICGLLDYGFSYAYLQNEFLMVAAEFERTSFISCLMLGLVGGPVSLLVSLVMGWTGYGLRFRRYKYANGVRQ